MTLRAALGPVWWAISKSQSRVDFFFHYSVTKNMEEKNTEQHRPESLNRVPYMNIFLIYFHFI
jgi:hypothetical protein